MGEIQTLSRAFDILFAIADAGRDLSVEEIATKTELPESTTYRLLQTLDKKGFIERRGRKHVGLGLKILELARSLNHDVDRELCIAAGPIMDGLTKKTGETSILMVRTGANVICIKSVESDRLIRFVTEKGRLLPLHISASGKAILAFERNVIIEQTMNSLEDQSEKDKLFGTLEI